MKYNWLLIGATCLLGNLANAQEVVHIKCGLLLDIQNEDVLASRDILVKDGMVSEIGDEITIPPGAVSIDLSDKVCMPGLIDAQISRRTAGNQVWGRLDQGDGGGGA